MLAVEVLVRGLASNRAKGHAINLRLTDDRARPDRAETMNILLRRHVGGSEGSAAVPRHSLGRKFERMLMQAQVTIPTPRLMLIILLAPVVIFFALLLLMVVWWGIGISSAGSSSARPLRSCSAPFFP